jgi:elongation factor P hydroxylase
LFNTPAGITQNYLYEKFIIMKQHDYQDLIKLFNHLFEFTENTILIAHGTEPLYLPQDENSSKNRIIFTHDYYSSALHEIAHWCIASKERRKLNDYGEAKPQALEWIFSVAAGIKFNISADNLALNNEISLTFKNLIYQQVIKYLTEGLPDRAELFKKSLLSFYNCDDIFDLSLFSLN